MTIFLSGIMRPIFLRLLLRRPDGLSEWHDRILQSMHAGTRSTNPMLRRQLSDYGTFHNLSKSKIKQFNIYHSCSNSLCYLVDNENREDSPCSSDRGLYSLSARSENYYNSTPTKTSPARERGLAKLHLPHAQVYEVPSLQPPGIQRLSPSKSNNSFYNSTQQQLRLNQTMFV